MKQARQHRAQLHPVQFGFGRRKSATPRAARSWCPAVLKHVRPKGSPPAAAAPRCRRAGRGSPPVRPTPACACPSAPGRAPPALTSSTALPAVRRDMYLPRAQHRRSNRQTSLLAGRSRPRPPQHGCRCAKSPGARPPAGARIRSPIGWNGSHERGSGVVAGMRRGWCASGPLRYSSQSAAGAPAAAGVAEHACAHFSLYRPVRELLQVPAAANSSDTGEHLQGWRAGVLAA